MTIAVNLDAKQQYQQSKAPIAIAKLPRVNTLHNSMYKITTYNDIATLFHQNEIILLEIFSVLTHDNCKGLAKFVYEQRQNLGLNFGTGKMHLSP